MREIPPAGGSVGHTMECDYGSRIKKVPGPWAWQEAPLSAKLAVQLLKVLCESASNG